MTSEIETGPTPNIHTSYLPTDRSYTMNARIALLFAPILLAACDHSGPQATPDHQGATPEIRLAPAEARKALGIAPDEMLMAIRADGKIVLYGAPGLDVIRIEKEVPFDPARTNKVGLTVTPATQDACFMVIIGGGKYWYPKPPCPVTK